MLVLHVNARTLTRLGAALRATLPDEAEDPETAMQALASAYITFATENRRLWQTLFEHRLPEGRGIPDWHKRDHAVLIEVIVPPLSRLRPDLGAEALALRARTIFAAVHGVVHLALQGRFVGVPAEALREEVAALVETLARGSAAARP